MNDLVDQIKHIIPTHKSGGWTFFPNHRLPDAQQREQERAIHSIDWTPYAPATLMFTSGSSGTPKLALHSYSNLIASAHPVVDTLALEEGDRWLLSLPLFHVGGIGIIYRCHLAGAEVVVPDRRSVAEMVEKRGITHLSMVATQLKRFLASPPKRHRLKAILLGGGPVPSDLLKKAWEMGFPIRLSYGMTEMSSLISCTEGNTLPSNAGKILEGREVKISAEGEILVRGKTLFMGYYSEKMLQRPSEWFATGDCGMIDGRGNIHIKGRLDRMFISGGENIQPEEVEQALTTLPGVRRAIVEGEDDIEYGQHPVAYIDADNIPPLEEVHAHLRDLLPRYKFPVKIFPMKALKKDSKRFCWKDE